LTTTAPLDADDGEPDTEKNASGGAAPPSPPQSTSIKQRGGGETRSERLTPVDERHVRGYASQAVTVLGEREEVGCSGGYGRAVGDGVQQRATRGTSDNETRRDRCTHAVMSLEQMDRQMIENNR
jgi:hypothetical protein